MKTEELEDGKKIRYCIITNNPQGIDFTANIEAVGFYQWLNVFEGQIFEARTIIPKLKDGDFDLIHVRVTPENLALIHNIRSCIGDKSQTKLIVSIDTPVKLWSKTFYDFAVLRDAVKEADFVFSTEYTICKAMEDLTSISVVHELPHPADLPKIKNYVAFKDYKNQDNSNIISVLYENKINFLLWLKYFKKRFDYRVRIIFYKDYEEKQIKRLKRNKIETVICSNEFELCNALIEGKIFLAPYSCSDYGKWVIYAAALGLFVIGNNLLDSSRRCYPFIHTDVRSIRACKKAAYFRLLDKEYVNYICDNADRKVEYYNLYNSRNRLLKTIYRETGDTRYKNSSSSTETESRAVVFSRDIMHVYGESELSYNVNELIVVCLVKNGMEYLNTFINHYNSLGVKHLVFIDNCSTDGTVEYLKGIENVTIYQTSLLHKHYENEIRRTIIENLINQRWCLCVDIDELFDYPCSNEISLSQFLDYLNQKKYTAVIAYMLDMFARESEDRESTEKGILTEKYCYYDISEVKKETYLKHNPNFCNYNLLSDTKMKNYYGGIRRKCFGADTAKYMLIKHPLMFIDRNIEPVSDPHYCNKAYIADVNCLLKHYKFTNTFKSRVDNVIEDYSFFGKLEHEKYSQIIKDKGEIRLFTSSAKKLDNINELLNAGFLRASRDFMEYAEKQASSE